MMKSNDFCINTQDSGSIWGKRSDWVEVNKVAKDKDRKEPVEYLGNFLTWDMEVWAVFHTIEINYLVRIEK